MEPYQGNYFICLEEFRASIRRKADDFWWYALGMFNWLYRRQTDLDDAVSIIYQIAKEEGANKVEGVHFGRFKYEFWINCYSYIFPYFPDQCRKVRRWEYAQRGIHTWLPTKKYVRNIEHQKKTNEDRVKGDWWLEKGFMRDKSRPPYGRFNNPKRWWKKYTSKKSRSRIRCLLRCESKWDDHIFITEPKWSIVDPWSWD